MEVDKNESEILHKALNEWEQTGMLTSETATSLKNSISAKQNDRQQVAQYFFFIALFCTLLAFGAIFLNEKLLEKIKVYFSWSDLVIAVITAVLSILWFWYIGRKRKQISAIAYEIDMILGGLATLTSLLYFCKYAHLEKSSTAFLSLSSPVLTILAWLLRSKTLWTGALIAAVGWFGAYTSFRENDLFLGMNYPVRYTVFGFVIIVVSFVQSRINQFSFTWRITYTIGLILFFTGFWGVSIFGNYSSLAEWQHVRQIHVLAYSVFFGIAAIVSFYLGIRYKDDLARDFGVLFLLINLYTRYFEYFWDTTNKGLFFLILAVTFGLVGWWLEKKSRNLKARP